MGKLFMEFARKHWYRLDGVLCIGLGVFLSVYWDRFNIVRRLLIMSFMALLVHQFEEYCMPGGFPGIFNVAVMGERKMPDRFPLDSNQAFVVNVPLAYSFYIAAIVFRKAYWLGMAQMLFGMAQFAFHGIVVNVKMKSLYNPGLGAVILLHFPIGIFYLTYVFSNGKAGTADLICGIAVAAVAAIAIIAAPIRLLANGQSKYPFAQAELFRFGKGKLLKMLEKADS